MSAEIVEEYARFLQPELYRKADQIVEQVIKDLIPDDLVEQHRRKWIRHLSQYDTGILAAAGVTVEGLVDIRTAALRQRHAGRKLPAKGERVLQRQRAYQAIDAANRAGLSWAETIDQVQVSSRMPVGRREIEIDRKTIDGWLRSLHEWGLVQIAPPTVRGRGRPRKKE